MKRLAVARSMSILALTGLLTGCGGGGGGEGRNPPSDIPEEVSYGIGAPQAVLSQQALTIDLAPGAASGGAVPPRPAAAGSSAECFGFPSGPDPVGDALPKLDGHFNVLTSIYDQSLHSKLWIDLPASAGGFQLALNVASDLRSASTLARGELGAGEITLAPREAYAGFPGTARLTFNGSATPACFAWDEEGDGTFEIERCLTLARLAALWKSPQADLGIPLGVQSAVAAAFAGWMDLQAQFDFSVGALLITESNHGALRAAPAGTAAVSVPGSVYPPTGTAGEYTLSWLDRNLTGQFDTGDDVRLVARDCWLRLEDGSETGAGLLLDGTFELRGYERNVGAAPTFDHLRITQTREIGGVVEPQETTELAGGFTVRAPGITASTGPVGAFRFTSDNMVAAGSMAAKAMAFYPDVGDLAYKLLDAARQSTASPRELGLASNGGASILEFTEGPEPNGDGLSVGDTVLLRLIHCDLGTPGHPRILDGTLQLVLWGVTLGPAADWSMLTTARLDLQATSTRASNHRLGEFGLSMAYVLGHSYYVGFQPQSFSGTERLEGVLTCLENGSLAYQVGCFDANYYTGTWPRSDFQLSPNHVVKTANRVFTMGMRQGEKFLFKADADGNYYPTVALAAMSSISAPLCTALGVPGNGVSGGDTHLEFDAWPADDGDTVKLRLYDLNHDLVHEVDTTWAELAQ